MNKTNEQKNSNRNNIDYNILLEYLKRKDINNYTLEELQLLTDLFKNNGYNINLLNIKDKQKK